MCVRVCVRVCVCVCVCVPPSPSVIPNRAGSQVEEGIVVCTRLFAHAYYLWGLKLKFEKGGESACVCVCL